MDQGINFLINQFPNKQEKEDQQKNREMDKGCEQIFDKKRLFKCKPMKTIFRAPQA